MSLVKWGFIALSALPAAEIAVFLLVALAVGWRWALTLFLATSLAGVLVLKHAGRADLARLRSSLGRRGADAIALEGSRLALVFGGILLVFPGFITDVVGLALLLPPVRRWAGAALSRALGQRQPEARGGSTIDLPPDQWHQIPDAQIDDRNHRHP